MICLGRYWESEAKHTFFLCKRNEWTEHSKVQIWTCHAHCELLLIYLYKRTDVWSETWHVYRKTAKKVSRNKLKSRTFFIRLLWSLITRHHGLITIQMKYHVPKHPIKHWAPLVPDIEWYSVEMSLWWSLVPQFCLKQTVLAKRPVRNRPGALSTLCVRQHLSVSQQHSHHNTAHMHTHFVVFGGSLLCGSVGKLIKNIPVGSDSCCFMLRHIFLAASDCGMMSLYNPDGRWLLGKVWHWALNLDLLSGSTRSRDRQWPLCHMTCQRERSAYLQRQTMRCLGRGGGTGVTLRFWNVVLQIWKLKTHEGWQEKLFPETTASHGTGTKIKLVKDCRV